jgi:hypothetical protein
MPLSVCEDGTYSLLDALTLGVTVATPVGTNPEIIPARGMTAHDHAVVAVAAVYRTVAARA